jgi:hypothetical protein
LPLPGGARLSGDAGAGLENPAPQMGPLLQRRRRMNLHIETALGHPVFDPERQIDRRFFWWAERAISVGLTCNIGME